MGSTKNGYVMKCSRTQGSKEILTEMDEGSLRSLEKYLLWEEMVRWRRKSKGKKIVNSDNGGREVEKDETNKQKKKRKWERQRKVGGQNSVPILKLNLRLSQLSQTELTQSTQKKTFFFKVFKYPKSQIFNSKFLFPKFQIHILNAQILNSTPQFSIKTQTSNFMIKIPSLDFKNSKGSKFQILNSRFQEEFFFKSLKSQNQNFKASEFQKSNVS